MDLSECFDRKLADEPIHIPSAHMQEQEAERLGSPSNRQLSSYNRRSKYLASGLTGYCLGE